MIIFMKKHLGSLIPMGERGAAELAKIKLDTQVRVEIKRPRNIGHHRKFWALMHEVAENQEHYPDAEAVAAVVKVETGHCDWVKTKHGMVGIPRSIAFHRLDQAAFEQFYDAAVKFICAEVIPGVDSDALRQRIEEIL